VKCRLPTRGEKSGYLCDGLDGMTEGRWVVLSGKEKGGRDDESCTNFSFGRTLTRGRLRAPPDCFDAHPFRPV